MKEASLRCFFVRLFEVLQIKTNEAISGKYDDRPCDQP